MARIALITRETSHIELGNPLLFGKALVDQNHDVTLVSIESLRMRANSIVADGAPFQRDWQENETFPALATQRIDHDFVWVHSIGNRESFLDKMQLLYALPDHSRVINSLDALMYLKSKYLVAANREAFPSPKTFASPDSDELLAQMQEDGGTWIIKPPAGSMGRDVFKMDSDDRNLRVLLESLCGPDKEEYIMIQRYLPEIEQGEKRVLLAGGQIIDQYRRFPGDDHRTNVSQGGKTTYCDLRDEEREYCEKLAQELCRRGAWFAGVDLVYPWLIEVNVISPGGVTTLIDLTGKDHSPLITRAVLDGAGSA